MSWFGMGPSWSPRGSHCYVTGGSQGLGLALALLLLKEGAHVSIVARDQAKLNAALEQLQAARITPDQKCFAYSHDLSKSVEAQTALHEACAPFDGRAPDAIFMCAGTAVSKFFLEAEDSDFESQVGKVYYTGLWTSRAATKLMVSQRVHGKLVFVSSLIGYMGLLGYSPYNPMKHALRGLADTLHSELQLYDISVHIFFPAGIDSPGLQEENRYKPAVLRKLEEDDDKPISPAQTATILLNGVKRGHAHIAGNFVGELFRASTRGTASYHNPFLDAVLATIAWIGVPIWRWGVDSKIKKHKPEHELWLKDHGFIPVDE